MDAVEEVTQALRPVMVQVREVVAYRYGSRKPLDIPVVVTLEEGEDLGALAREIASEIVATCIVDADTKRKRYTIAAFGAPPTNKKPKSLKTITVWVEGEDYEQQGEEATSPNMVKAGTRLVDSMGERYTRLADKHLEQLEKMLPLAERMGQGNAESVRAECEKEVKLMEISVKREADIRENALIMAGLPWLLALKRTYATEFAVVGQLIKAKVEKMTLENEERRRARDKAAKPPKKRTKAKKRKPIPTPPGVVA